MRWAGVLEVRSDGRPKELRARLGVYAAALGLVYLTVLGRLWVLQVVHGEEYAAQAEGNHLKEREIPAPRGAIYDAHGHRIAEVRASFDLVVVPRDVDPEPSPILESAAARGGPLLPEEAPEVPVRTDIRTLASRLAPLLDDADEEEMIRRFEAGRAADSWRSTVLASDLSREALERVLAARPRLPGVSIEARHRRSYPDGGLFAHVVGYLREVRADELQTLRDRYRSTEKGEDYYGPGDRIGKWGLEGAWESWLRGDGGAYWVQVDAHGRELGRSAAPDLPGEEYFRSIAHFLDDSVLPEKPGHDLHLTIRRDLQQRAMELFTEQDYSGAAVVMEVHTGRVLVLASAPVFDPDLFSRPISRETWKALSEDPTHPLSDKALQGVYPPGSTYKMVIAAAVLGTDTWTAETSVHCPGYYRVGNRPFRCWKRTGHGKVNLESALQGSCDVYFYRAGLALGIDTVASYAEMFGFGSPTGIGINSERGGLNPTTAWKQRRYRKNPQLGRWTPGDTASAVIGQGYTLATPMQLASMTATLANGGRRMRPLLVDRVVGPDGEVVQRGEPEVLGRIDLSAQHLEEIRRGMEAVVGLPGGTAFRQRIPGLPYAGKTGTAQVVRLGASTAEHLRDHAWFVGYAPADDPEIAACVLVENGEHGSTAAAPIVRKLFEQYFADRLPAAPEIAARKEEP